MQVRQLGAGGPQVSAVGLGMMGMSDLYGPADDAESAATLAAAAAGGVTLFDTADFYGSGHNELLLRDLLRGRPRDAVVISAKFGALRTPQGGWSSLDARPEAVRNFLAYTLRRLGTDHVDVYRPARVDPAVPIEDTVGAIAREVKAGTVRHIGLSEVSAETLRRAHAEHPIADVQIEYSLFSRGIEEDLLPTARELGVGITAYGVLSRGLLSGRWPLERALPRADFRAYLPRFRRGNVEMNLALVERVRALATQLGVSVAQMAIGWVLAQGDDIVPVVGARTRAQLTDLVAAADLRLAPADVAALESAVPAASVAGERYDAAHMKTLDSERALSGR